MNQYDSFGPDAVEACVEAFKQGKPVMVFDSAFRERETDLLWFASRSRAASQRRLVLLTTKGETCLWDFTFHEKDIILVGRESSGVPEAVRVSADVRVYIPIQPPLRSLNVGIAATIAMTEALRQLGRLPSSRKGEG